MFFGQPVVHYACGHVCHSLFEGRTVLIIEKGSWKCPEQRDITIEWVGKGVWLTCWALVSIISVNWPIQVCINSLQVAMQPYFRTSPGAHLAKNTSASAVTQGDGSSG